MRSKDKNSYRGANALLIAGGVLTVVPIGLGFPIFAALGIMTGAAGFVLAGLTYLDDRSIT